MSSVIRCLLCERDGPSAKAHITPNGFIRPMKSSGQDLVYINLDNPAKEKKIQSGTWDRTILCQHCETRLAPLDAYGIRFFRDEEFAFNRVVDKFTETLEFVGVDNFLLKKFLLFVAWRFGATMRPEFASVDLGDRLDELRQLVDVGSPGTLAQFPSVVKRYSPHAAHHPTGMMVEVQARDFALNPCVVEWAGRRVLQFYLANYVIYMAIDNVTPEGFWATCSVGVEGGPRVIVKQLGASGELAFVRDRFRRVRKT